MKIIKKNNKQINHYEQKLLLNADPSIKSICNYINNSDTFQLINNLNELIGIIVVKKHDKNKIEIMNLSIDENYQGQHLGPKLISFVINQFKNDFNYLDICTGSTSFQQLYIYQKLGFRCIEIKSDHFININLYPNEIIENNLVLKDLIRLRLSL